MCYSQTMLNYKPDQDLSWSARSPDVAPNQNSAHHKMKNTRLMSSWNLILDQNGTTFLSSNSSKGSPRRLQSVSTAAFALSGRAGVGMLWLGMVKPAQVNISLASQTLTRYLS